MMDRQPSSSAGHVSRHASAAIGLLAVGLALPACERRDPQSSAIAGARNTITVAASGGSAAAPRALLANKYSQTLSVLKEGEGGDEATVAIANAIEAAAIGGQGEIAVNDFRLADAALMMELNSAQALLRLYSEQRALEASLKGYDPNADISRFDGMISERESELGQRAQARDANKKKVDGLLARAETLAEQARSMMQAQAALRQRLEGAAASERQSIAEQLNKARREAEGVMKQSEFLEAEAAQFQPVTGELDLMVKQVERQIASLQHAKEQARRLAETRAAQTDEARRAAEATAEQVAASVSGSRRVLEESVKPAFQAALAKLNQSAAKFGQSRGGPDQKLLAVATGSAAQAVAALQREYGESLARVATLLDLAAKARPPIAGSEEFASAAQALSVESRGAFETALQQYERARSLYQSGGGNPELRERLDHLVARINDTWIRLGGKPPEEPKPAEPPPAEESAPAEPSEQPEAAPEGMTPDGESPAAPDAPAESPESPDSPGETPPETPPER